MTIEFTNATPAKSQSTLSVALLVLSCLFFFVPATLIVLGYYSSLPTGTLVSPLPKGVLSTYPTPTTQTPVIAAPQETEKASSSATISSNATQKSIILPASQTEIAITDSSISGGSQIYLLNREGDKSLYTVKSKSVGQFVLSTPNFSDSVRTIDYQIVNP